MKTGLSIKDWLCFLFPLAGGIAAYAYDPHNPFNHPAIGVVVLIATVAVIWMAHRDAKHFAEQRAELDEGWRRLREQDEELWRRYCPHSDRRT